MTDSGRWEQVRGRRLTSPVVLIIVVSVLYVARAVLIPLALALLLAFLLAPLARGLERRRVPRVLASVGVVTLAMAGLVAIVALLGQELFQIGRQLPVYLDNIQAKLTPLFGDGPFAELMDVFDRFEVAESADVMRVEVVTANGEWSALLETARPLLAVVGTAGLVVVFTVFMLLQWEDLRERILRLSGQRHLSTATEALGDAGARVSRYLQMQLLINVITGASVGIGVAIAGVPNGFVWGLAATILRFIPYVGPWVAAILPVTFSFATSTGWTEPLVVAGIVIVIELVANNVLEPWLYGTASGVSPVGIVVMAVFWAWLWGAVGLVLATPLTVCLVVAGRYLPQLEFLHVLLSDQRALPSSARLYHRLLSLEPEEASDLVDVERAAQGELGLFDEVLVPALEMAERERHAGRLSEERASLVYDSLDTFIDESGASAAEGEETDGIDPSSVVLCVPAGDRADRLAAAMLQQVLQGRGIETALAPEEGGLSALIERIALDKPSVLAISAVPPAASVQARDLCRKLHQLFPRLPVVVGHWMGAERSLDANALRRLRESGADTVVSTIAEAAKRCAELLEEERGPDIADSLPPASA